MAPIQENEYEIINNEVKCPRCHVKVSLGRGGIQNFIKQHLGTRTCEKKKAAREAAEKREAEAKAQQERARLFFAPKTPNVPPTVRNPKPIRPLPIPRSTSLKNTAANSQAESGTSYTPPPPDMCSLAATVLARFYAKIQTIPKSVEDAGDGDPFAPYAGDLSGCVDFSVDVWEQFDGPLNQVLQRPPEELRGLVRRGPKGVLGLHRLLDYLARHHQLQGALFEMKIERLITAIDEVIALHPPDPTAPNQPQKIEQDAIENPISVIVIEDDMPDSPIASTSTKQDSYACNGILAQAPDGKSMHASYPYGVHDILGDPWNYTVNGGLMTLHARTCLNVVGKAGAQCTECEELAKNPNLQGILRRMEEGVHPNARLAYHPIGSLIAIARQKAKQIDTLRLKGLNDARKIMGKATVLDNFKQFMMAVASGKVERIERLIKAWVQRRGGIRGLLKAFEIVSQAAQKVYRTRTYTEEDELRGLLFWRIGGARVAVIGQNSLGLPSLSHLRRKSIIPRIVASPGQPTVQEVAKNTASCLKELEDVVNSKGVVHQVVMLDELKVEERIRWDDLTNHILGICREHGSCVSLEFNSKLEADLLMGAIRGEVHLATEATVSAIGLMSNETRIYGARPVLVSGSCKRESGSDHARLIRAVTEGVKTPNIRTICIASDGESRRAEALVIETLKKVLDPASPIYKHLKPLPFMNLEVGDDDVTAEKDYKHVFKRLRNLLLRNRGILIHNIHVTQHDIRKHLRANGATEIRVNRLLDPEDKQDVKLAYDLLSKVWNLPLAPTNSPPRFIEVRECLRTLGILFRHLLLPYICVDLSLSEQLSHLSAAAHITLALWREGKAGTKLMPTQLYIDIMIMIKNVYFCVAKTKVDNPKGQFWVILLGTDCLEELFGILRTMVGNDANVDVLQLALRLTGTTEVATILAKHPEWDRAPRRLKLPPLSKDMEIHGHVDHIKPSSWRGNVHVDSVNLHSCWRLGRQNAVEEVPQLKSTLVDAKRLTGDAGSVNILRPLGKDIIQTYSEADSTENQDDTAEDFGLGPSTSSNGLQPVDPPDGSSMVAASLEVEDIAAEDEELSLNVPWFDLNGEKIYKARFLNQEFKDYKNPGSRDRLKRVANVP